MLDPLVEALRRYVLAADKVHADDTPLPVLAPGEGRTKTARLWTYVRDDRPAGSNDPPAVWFAYSPNRKGEHPQRYLRIFTGILQADAYAGFNAIYATGQVQEAACWAHLRRKLFDVHRAQASPIAAEALTRIGQLYAIEASVRGEPPPIRRAARQARLGTGAHRQHAASAGRRAGGACACVHTACGARGITIAPDRCDACPVGPAGAATEIGIGCPEEQGGRACHGRRGGGVARQVGGRARCRYPDRHHQERGEVERRQRIAPSGDAVVVRREVCRLKNRAAVPITRGSSDPDPCRCLCREPTVHQCALMRPCGVG
ncbi:hypothetical protein CJ010_10625 [Azoarcus sp. DD4]|nr:hypothetical protein CJ010_10625 [Azoarcus sp. DD4]